MMEKRHTIIIMAGGLGKRMGGELPKVVHPVGGVPMIVRILRELEHFTENKRILIVVGKYRAIIEATIQQYIDINVEYVVQDPALGTGHAIACCLPYISPSDSIVVLSGDVPLIKHQTISQMFVGNPFLRVLTMVMANPYGYGRIICDDQNKFVKIVEHKDCNDDELDCCVVNCGIYGFRGEVAHRFIPLISNINTQREYYLTDIVGLAHNAGINVEIAMIEHERVKEVIGINTLEELNRINDLFV